MLTQKPILVTGSHRSGTSFTGKILSLDKSISYISEPFNKSNRNGTRTFNVNFWYQFINESNDTDFLINFEKTLNFKFTILPQKIGTHSFKNLAFIIYSFFENNRVRILNKRPLVKDPIAFFSAPWLAKNFNMDVIILIRHPAAFVNSVINLNWSHDFKDFLNQPLLMNSHLAPFKEEIEKFSLKEYPIIEQAILLWKIFYSTVLVYQKNHPDWIYLRHEDLSENPIDEFRLLFKKLNLNFSDQVKRKIINYTSNNSLDPLTIHPFNLKRNSKINKELWRTQLSMADVEFIRNGVEEVSKFFYSDSEW